MKTGNLALLIEIACRTTKIVKSELMRESAKTTRIDILFLFFFILLFLQ